MVAFSPGAADPPVLAVRLSSDWVLAVSAGEADSTTVPARGDTAWSCPYSDFLVALNGMAAATSLAARACSTTMSLVLSVAPESSLVRRGAAVFGRALTGGRADLLFFFLLAGMAVPSMVRERPASPVAVDADWKAGRSGSLGEKLGLALAELGSQLHHVQPGGLGLGEHLFLLFLDVVLHVLGQHFDPGIEHFTVGFDALDLGDEVLQGGMLHRGFRNKFLVLQGLLDGRVKNLLFHLRMHAQLGADARDQFFLSGRGARFFVFGKQTADQLVVGAQQCGGFLSLGHAASFRGFFSCRCHGEFPFWIGLKTQ